MRKIAEKVYEVFMILLVCLTIATIWADTPYDSAINWMVWLVFFIDYSIRFFTARSKWQFVKGNPFLLIAVIPFDQFFQMARIVRLVHLFRIKTITKFYIVPYADKLSFRIRAIMIAAGLLVLAVFALIILGLENTVHAYMAAAYIVIRHLFFVGNAGYAIENALSIGILTVTSISGIVVQGLILQWVFAKADSWIKSYSLSDRSEQRRDEG